MHTRRRSWLDLGELLAAVENAPPVAAADVVGQQLAQALNASEVAFLIADFSGDLLMRLSHDETLPTSNPDRDMAERVPLGGSAHGRVLEAQTAQVDRHGAEAHQGRVQAEFDMKAGEQEDAEKTSLLRRVAELERRVEQLQKNDAGRAAPRAR